MPAVITGVAAMVKSDPSESTVKSYEPTTSTTGNMFCSIMEVPQQTPRRGLWGLHSSSSLSFPLKSTVS